MLAGPPHTVEKARKLRRTMSVPEVVLWTRLRLRPDGFKFRRQHPAGRYILDFFCNEVCLAIEIDGVSHTMGNRPEADLSRDAWLTAQDVATLRVAASDISRNPDEVLETIIAACRERQNPLYHAAHGPPPRSGEET